MLVLARKENEEIVITCPSGDLITIKAVRISRDKVRIGTSAPAGYKVNRREVHDAIRPPTSGSDCQGFKEPVV